jgi:hypothetical protein
MTYQSHPDRIAALESLLPLLEAHQHVVITARAQWVSAQEEAPPPRDPEPSCECHCPPCPYLLTRSCTLREVAWAAAWESLRKRYPQLHTLELLLHMLGQHHARWAAAIYRVYVPLWEWDVWDMRLERDLARHGVEWIEERFEGWIPLHVEEAAIAHREKPRVVKRQWVADMLAQGFTSARICKEARCSERLVVEVRKTIEVER